VILITENNLRFFSYFYQCCGSGFIESESGSSISSESGSNPDPRLWWTKLEGYRRSLQPSKENIRHFKKWNLVTFYIFVGHFCPPGSGSTTLISTVGSENESGYKISFEWLLPQGPPTVEYHKKSEFLADKDSRELTVASTLPEWGLSWRRSASTLALPPETEAIFTQTCYLPTKLPQVSKYYRVLAMPNLGLDFNNEAVSGSGSAQLD
jgi:hypothetical protein